MDGWSGVECGRSIASLRGVCVCMCVWNKVWSRAAGGGMLIELLSRVVWNKVERVGRTQVLGVRLKGL